MEQHHPPRHAPRATERPSVHEVPISGTPLEQVTAYLRVECQHLTQRPHQTPDIDSWIQLIRN